jgi:hypothetical protein
MPLPTITQFPFGGALTAANLNAPVNDLKAKVDPFYDTAVVKDANGLVTIVSPGAAYQGLVVRGAAGNPAQTIFAVMNNNGSVNNFFVFSDGSGTFRAGVTAPTYAGTLLNTDAQQRIRQTPGTKLFYVAGGSAAQYDAQLAEWAIGTSGAPATLGGPLLKLSVTHNQPANLYAPSANVAITEASVALSLYTNALATQAVQNGGLYVLSQTASTQPGADTVALMGVGVSLAGSTRTGFGAYIQAQRASSGGYAVAMEVRAQNESGVDSGYTTPASWGAADTYGINLGSSGTGGKRSATGLYIYNAGSPFTAGVVFAANSASLASIDDASSSTFHGRVTGTHLYGYDFNGGTFTGGVIRLPSGGGIVARNNANSTDLNVIAKNTSDQVVLYGTVAIDSAGNINTPGSLRTGSGSVLITNTDGTLAATGFRPGSIPGASLANGAVVPNSAMTVAIGALSFHNVATGTLTTYAGSASYTITTPVSGNLYHLLSVTDAGVLSDVTATTTAAALLPVNNRKLALIGPITNATTVITAARIDTTPDFRPPQAPGASGLVVAPAGVQTSATDATLADLLASRFVSPYLPLYLGFSGTSVTLTATGGVQHAVYVNAKMRTITSTVTLSMVGQAAGAYFLFADVSDAGVATFKLAVSSTNNPNANQMTIGTFYWNGTAFVNEMNVNTNSRAVIAQVQPKMVVSGASGGPQAITNTGGLVQVSTSFFPGYSYATSASQTYYFNGILFVNLHGGSAGCSATVQPFLNGTAAGVTFGSKTLIAGATSYDQIVVATNIPLAVNQINTLTIGANAGAATGYFIDAAYFVGTISGGV